MLTKLDQELGRGGTLYYSNEVTHELYHGGRCLCLSASAAAFRCDTGAIIRNNTKICLVDSWVEAPVEFGLERSTVDKKRQYQELCQWTSLNGFLHNRVNDVEGFTTVVPSGPNNRFHSSRHGGSCYNASLTDVFEDVGLDVGFMALSAEMFVTSELLDLRFALCYS